MIPTKKDLATAIIKWHPDQLSSKNLYLIEVKGKWETRTGDEELSFRIYLHSTLPPNKMIQSDDQKENTDMKEINPVEVYGETDAIVVKGAENGATIKICNQSGVEIKSVVANNNVVRIDLPAKQLYLVYVGDKSFKITL